MYKMKNIFKAMLKYRTNKRPTTMRPFDTTTEFVTFSYALLPVIDNNCQKSYKVTDFYRFILISSYTLT